MSFLLTTFVLPHCAHCTQFIIYISVVNFDALAQASDSLNAGLEPRRSLGTEYLADWMPADKSTELSRIMLRKTWTRQPVTVISEHSTHSTPLPFGIRKWLWRYTCLLLLISMLWHRKRFSNRKVTGCRPLLDAGFEPRGSLGTEYPADWMPADQPTELSRIKLKKLNLTARPYDQPAFSHSTPLPFGTRSWLWRYTCLFFGKFDALVYSIYYIHTILHSCILSN